MRTNQRSGSFHASTNVKLILTSMKIRYVQENSFNVVALVVMILEIHVCKPVYSKSTLMGHRVWDIQLIQHYLSCHYKPNISS